jgi:hypothetical protein
MQDAAPFPAACLGCVAACSGGGAMARPSRTSLAGHGMAWGRKKEAGHETGRELGSSWAAAGRSRNSPLAALCAAPFHKRFQKRV